MGNTIEAVMGVAEIGELIKAALTARRRVGGKGLRFKRWMISWWRFSL